LDSKTGNEIMNMISDLHKEGKTIILITHEKEIAAYAKRNLFLRDGMFVDKI
jgi:putative ABC transport system ATP-binding protein